MIIGLKMINNFLHKHNSKQIIQKIILFFVILFLLEIPINDWFSFLIFSLLSVVILFHKINLTKNNYYLIIVFIIISSFIKINNTSQIHQGFLIYPTSDFDAFDVLLPEKVNKK